MTCDSDGAELSVSGCAPTVTGKCSGNSVSSDDVSCAVGTHLIEDPGGDPLGLTGFSFPTALGEETSGFRLVTVERERLTHKWFSLAEAPDVVEPVAAAAAWRRGEEPNTTARL